MKFQCEYTFEHGKEEWIGRIEHIYNYGNHYEVFVISRSSILLIIGKTSLGYFACAPDFQAGCHLSSFDDIFYNTEKLCEAMGIVDGVTAAKAIYEFDKYMQGDF